MSCCLVDFHFLELFLQASGKSVAISFYDLFSGVIDDILPFGSGPYLLLSYLEQWYVLFIQISVVLVPLALVSTQVMFFCSCLMDLSKRN